MEVDIGWSEVKVAACGRRCQDGGNIEAEAEAVTNAANEGKKWRCDG